MPFDRAAAVARSRRVIHDYMKVAAVYTFGGVATPLSVRWHNRALAQGNLVESGYSDVIEGIDAIVFDREELAEKNIVLKVGGTVALTDPSYNGIVLRLDTQQPDTGPVNRVWGVTR